LTPIDLAVLGGSGLYQIAGLTEIEEVEVETPYGAPSDRIHLGTLEGRRMAFLARHGQGHHLLPGEIPFQANIWALKSLGVRQVLSISAVGSMRESMPPRHMVLVDQFIDRTHGRPSTFFGDGIVAHVSLADPTCGRLATAVQKAAGKLADVLHVGGTYLCMEGPAFSTRAESALFRSWGVDVIGMTNIQEARLCREAEICFATLALVTDFDCWHEEEDDVSVEGLLETLRANGEAAEALLIDTLPKLAGEWSCACATALDGAILTPHHTLSPETRERLAPILARVLEDKS